MKNLVLDIRTKIKTFTIKLFFLLNVFSLTQHSYGQNGWIYTNPLPTDKNIYNIYFINKFTGFVAGQNGLVFKTSNMGYNWSQLSPECNYKFTSIYFINSYTGFVTSGNEFYNSNDIVMKTTNGGQNWTQNFTTYNISLYCVKFINNDTGYLCGFRLWWGGIIFRTTDGGSTWVQYPMFQMNALRDICFTSIDTGYACGDDGKILKTTDSGDTWAFLDPQIGSYSFQSIFFTSSNTGYTVGTYGSIAKTTDAGQHWFMLNSGTHTNLSNIIFKNSSTGFISSGGTSQEPNGKILKTENSGITWDSIFISDHGFFRAIRLLDSNTIISVGNSGNIINSTNSGNSWSSLRYSITNSILNRISFLDDLGFVAGYDGSILRTTNRGLTWDYSSIDSNYIFDDISIVNNHNIFLAGEYGIVMKSTDSGLSWFPLSSGTDYNIAKIQFINDSIGYTVGYKTGYPNPYYFGKILKSTNSGLSWENIYSCNFHLTSGYFLNENSGYVGGIALNNSTYLLFTSNAGLNWENLHTFSPAFRILDIEFLNSFTGFLSGTGGILKTTDGGTNWVEKLSVSGRMFFINQNTGYCTDGLYLYKTIDRGDNWYMQCSQTYGTHDLCFLDVNTGFCVGDNGTILKTSNGGGQIIGLGSEEIEIPSALALAQNYPNPFNPITTIKFSIPPSSHNASKTVSLIIYDLLGREVCTLVNMNLSPGKYEVHWDGTNFASGVYFYSLITESLIQTKKFILLK